MADSDPDVRWMSYAEAARTLRVTSESLHRRMRRNGWARREGNDGKPRVAVPIDVLRRFDPVPDNFSDDVPDSRDRMIAALEAERDAARLATARAEGESGTLREQVESERARADRAEAEREAARAEAAAERARATQAEREREASAEGEAKGLREALAEARRPFWRRWLGP